MAPHNGYILLAKKTKDSEVYRKPPFYREVWLHLLMSVRFSDQTRLVERKHRIIKAGQIYTTYGRIAEDLHWYDNKKKYKYSTRLIRRAIEFFKEKKMVRTEKLPRGVLITVCKYKIYQKPENYKRELWLSDLQF